MIFIPLFIIITPEGNLAHLMEEVLLFYNCIIKVDLLISILDDASIAYYVLLKTWKG